MSQIRNMPGRPIPILKAAAKQTPAFCTLASWLIPLAAPENQTTYSAQ
jgi:hypothetical protein